MMRSSGRARGRAAQGPPRRRPAETPRRATSGEADGDAGEARRRVRNGGNFIGFAARARGPRRRRATAFLALFPGDAAAVAVVVTPETKFPYRSRAFGESAEGLTARVSALSRTSASAPPSPPPSSGAWRRRVRDDGDDSGGRRGRSAAARRRGRCRRTGPRSARPRGRGRGGGVLPLACATRRGGGKRQAGRGEKVRLLI